MGESQNKGLIVVISGPSGVGKGTVITGLREQRNFEFSISHTTRGQRPGEVDGVNYHYVSKAQFEQLLEAGKMLESTVYNGNYYGTSREAVECIVSEGKDVLLDIEVEGGANIRRTCPEAVEIFLMPPSFGELEQRLRGRGSEEEPVIQGRLAIAKREIACAKNYDYIVVNRTVDQAVKEILCILDSVKMQVKYRGWMPQSVLDGEKI
jgi:guanylate kinase